MALLLGLVLLAALSLLAVTTANGMLLQRRMAGNYQEDSRALQDASVAIAAARAWLFSRAQVERESGCIEACLLPVAIHGAGELPPHPEFESAAWWRTHAVAADLHPGTGDGSGFYADATEPARWLMEEAHYALTAESADADLPRAIGYYRLLARGAGANPGSVVVIESVVARPWEGDIEAEPYPPDRSSGAFCAQFDPVVPCGTLSWRQRK